MKAKSLASLALVTLSSLLFSISALALSTDRDQPAQIEADSTEIDFKTGVRTLTDNVLVVQGTLRLKADKLVATYKNGQLVKAIANGSLARFKQRPDGQPDDVEGWAKKMIIDYPTNTVTLIGKAALRQGETTGRGSKIVYNMDTDKLRIVGGSNVGTAGKAGAAKPTRKIEDPFKDDADGPAEAPAPVIDTAKASDDDATAVTPKAPKPQARPLKSGRSRLILQPKKKPEVEKDADADDADKDTDKSTDVKVDTE